MKEQIKNFTRQRLPFLHSMWRRIKYVALSRRPPEAIFTEIYEQNKWGDEESRSGTGSNLIQTESLRTALPLLIRTMNIKSLLDIPCGDFNWMKLITIDVDYIGADIVVKLIEDNQRLYGNEKRKYYNLDLIKDLLPTVDLILCRDCLVHFSYNDIFRSLRNIKQSGSMYILTTTFVRRQTNQDIPTGSWRPINLQKPPFNFPNPINLIDEKCPFAGFEDKQMGLWRVIDIPSI